MKKSNLPIGIFDSGLGGLTVFKEIERILPCENVIYFGDTARVPYGSKSRSTIIRFSTENILFLLKKRVKIIVIACNTSSSLALDYLKKIFTIPILGVVSSGVERACAVCRGKGIGVIATRATIESASYQKKLVTAKKIKVYAKACPLFVPLVEENITDGRIVDLAVKMYLADLRGKIDTLILGCTHYPLLKSAIASYLKGVYLVDSAKEVALKTKDVLAKKNLLNFNKGSLAKKEFYVTDEPKAFSQGARIFLNRQIKNIRVVNV